MIYNNKGKDVTTQKAIAWTVAHLRRQWLQYDGSRKAKIHNNRFKAINKLTGRQAFHLKCEHCKCNMIVKEAKIHHIIPIGSLKDYTLVEYIERMFCSGDKLAIVCDNCHKEIHNNLLNRYLKGNNKK